MKPLAVARVSHLLPFEHVLAAAGADTAKLLERHALPPYPSEVMDQYFSVPHAFRFMASAEREGNLQDLGFLASNLISLEHLNGKLAEQASGAQSLLPLLRAFVEFGAIENNQCRFWIEPNGQNFRLCSSLEFNDGAHETQYSVWIQNRTWIEMVRLFAGPNWTPKTLAFECRFCPGELAHEAFPNTRFLTCQPYSWVDLPMGMLALERHHGLASDPGRSSNDENTGTSSYQSMDFLSSLKALVPAYFPSGGPSLNMMAEIVGVSKRTLQRRLAQSGTSFRDLLLDSRHDQAAQLLSKTDMSITEVALSIGFDDSSHFARSFRRRRGLSPGEYRRFANTQPGQH